MHHKSIKVQTKRGFEDLDLEIKAFITRINGILTCQACGKQSGSINHRGHISTHIESKHMDLSEKHIGNL